jgi:hypothetical protein
MHRAPAISFSVTRSRWQLRATVALGSLGLASIASFVYAQSDFGWRALLSLGVVPVVVAVALVAWWKAPRGILQWNGQQWNWSGFTALPACQVSLLMDFQSLLLVSLTSDTERSVCLWLEAGAGVADWQALRRAIVSGQSMVRIDVDRAQPRVGGDGA